MEVLQLHTDAGNTVLVFLIKFIFLLQISQLLTNWEMIGNTTHLQCRCSYMLAVVPYLVHKRAVEVCLSTG